MKLINEKIKGIVEVRFIKVYMILWPIAEETFYSKFPEHFALKHNLIMKSHLLQEKFDQVMRSHELWEFENQSHLPIFQNYNWNETQSYAANLRS